MLVPDWHKASCLVACIGYMHHKTPVHTWDEWQCWDMAACLPACSAMQIHNVICTVAFSLSRWIIHWADQSGQFFAVKAILAALASFCWVLVLPGQSFTGLLRVPLYEAKLASAVDLLIPGTGKALSSQTVGRLEFMLDLLRRNVWYDGWSVGEEDDEC